MRRYLDLLLPPTKLSGADAAAEAQWRADAPGSYCGRCGATAAAAALTLDGCPVCRDRRLPWQGVWRLGAYADPLSQWVVELKFQQGWIWGEYFGHQLAAVTAAVQRSSGPTVVVPVPLHWRRRWQRGYDQASLIARSFAAAHQLPLARVIRRVRPTQHQSDIHSHAQRLANVRRAFTLRSAVDLTGWTVWLIDDVKTTGATASACTRLLRRAGAQRVNLAVVAVADPKQPQQPIIDD